MKEECRSRALNYLKPDRKGKGYICPLCQSGSGKNGTGMSVKDGVLFSCWSCSSIRSKDIIDIIAIENGLQDSSYIDKLRLACNVLGVQVDEDMADTPRTQQKATQTPKQATATKTETAEKQLEQEQPKIDYHKNGYYKKCRQALTENKQAQQYLLNRGLTMETLKKNWVGYDEQQNRIIIPINDYCYNARLVLPDEEIKAKGLKKYIKPKGVKSDVFGSNCLYTNYKGDNEVIYIVEGELDCLSVKEVGFCAIGLGSLGNKNILLNSIERQKANISPETKFIVALDNDVPKIDEKTQEPIETEAHKTVSELVKGISLLGYTVMSCEMPFNSESEPYKVKDFNQALQENKKEFAKYLESQIELIKELSLKKSEEQRAESDIYIQNNSGLGLVEKFQQYRAERKTAPKYSTGFNGIDKILGDGLQKESLYTIGAISSLGKTAITLQIADYIAKNGTDVLYFSLEMSEYELMARTYSRYTYMIERNENEKGIDGEYSGARTTTDILKDRKPNGTTARAEQIYSTNGNGKHLYYITDDVSTADIEKAVKKHIEYTGNTPIVFIDYLQILKPLEPKATDKQNIDMAVKHLKRIARDYKTAVWEISSLNRLSYNKAVDMESFKESGAIEFSSDVLIGMFFTKIESSDTTNTTEKMQSIRNVTVRVLKNRNGGIGDTEFLFRSKYNYFEEDTIESNYFQSFLNGYTKQELLSEQEEVIQDMFQQQELDTDEEADGTEEQ